MKKYLHISVLLYTIAANLIVLFFFFTLNLQQLMATVCFTLKTMDMTSPFKVYHRFKNSTKDAMIKTD